MLDVQYLGRVPYLEGLNLQRETWQRRLDEEIPDTLLLLEHDSVFTMGRRDTQHDLLLPESELSAPVVRTDRGGELTYHGPGQLVGYLHAKLSTIPSATKRGGIGIKELVYRLEESVLLLLQQDYGLDAWRDMQHRGVWLESGKIAAIGIAVKKGISMHGFALNVSTNLDFFTEIVPCGISDRGVTSLARELGKGLHPARLSLIAEQFLKYFSLVFGYKQAKSIF